MNEEQHRDTTDARMRKMEQWQAAHEVRCDERYNGIHHMVSDIRNTMATHTTAAARRMDWLLLAVIALALANVVGVDNIRTLLRIASP